MAILVALAPAQLALCTWRWYLCGEKSQLLLLGRFYSIHPCLSSILLWLLYMLQGSRPALLEFAYER